MRLEPAHVILLGNAGTSEEPALPAGTAAAEIGQRKIADQPAVFFQHRRQRHAAGLWQLAGKQAIEPGRGARARHPVFGEGRDFRQADTCPHRPHLFCDMLEIARAPPREFVPDAFGRIPQRHFQPKGHAPLRALRRQKVVDRRGLERPPGRQFLIGEADGKTPRIILAHLGVGVGHRRPVAVARDIHRPDVGAGIALDHPVRQRQANTAALRKPGHDAAGDPEARQAAHRPDQRVAVGREGEGAVDDLLDAGVLEGREMPEPDFQ